MENALYEKTTARLARAGIKDPTNMIIALAEEIERYRAKINGLEQQLVELSTMAKDGRLIAVPIPGDVLYETDPEHGVVEHTVTDVHWVANTTAKDDSGNTWADYYTDEDIDTAHETRGAAETVLAAGSIMEG